jgi:PAS domain S-box-containing protein
MWCIEYTEAVDLSIGEQEILRQVFENECHWNMCNRAMAEIYNLPAGLDLNQQRVSRYFRRNPTNEAFVRQLIDSRFHIDSAPSVDVRHDGTVAYVENSVRCHIEDGKMRRMWGTVRDMTEFRVAHNRLAQREREVREVLSAIPDAVLVINKSQQVLAVNPAFESSFGWRTDNVLGKSACAIINVDSNTEDDHRWFARAERRWTTDVNKADGTSVSCDVRMAPISDDELSRYVLCIRPATPANDIVTTPNVPRRRRARQAALPR